MKILLIEDEEELRNTVREYLTREKFIVECAEDYASAMEKVNDYDYDCILLDIMLPLKCTNGQKKHTGNKRNSSKTPLMNCKPRWPSSTASWSYWPNMRISMKRY